MNKLLAATVFTALLGFGAMPAPVVAAPHTVRGAGKDSQSQAFQIRAQGTPSQATGRVSFGFGTQGQQGGMVDCLAVEGHRAALSGTLDAPVDGLSFFVILVKDDPKRGSRPRDLFYVQLRNAPSACADEFQSISGLRIKRGDIKVE